MPSTAPAADTGLPADYTDPATLPETYGLRINGNCMAPDYPDGSEAAFSTAIPFQHGDVVAVWFRPGVLTIGGKPFQCMIKSIVMMPPMGIKFPHREHPESEVHGLIMLGSNDKPDTMLPIPCGHVLAIHKCIGPMPGEEQRAMPRARRGRALR